MFPATGGASIASLPQPYMARAHQFLCNAWERIARRPAGYGASSSGFVTGFATITCRLRAFDVAARGR